MTEDEIAALDSDWTKFTPAEQAAYTFCRKFTYEPHLLNDADIATLRKHYKDLQILEMTLSMAGNNSINRWKEGVGVPQSADGGNFGRKGDATQPATPPKASHSTYLTPTSDLYKDRITKVAVLQQDAKSGNPTKQTIARRPALESREEVEKLLEAARKRTPRLPLVDEAKARELVAPDWTGPLPQWVRLMANFPVQGKGRVASQKTAEEKGDLTPLLKAQVSWIVARQDRAWYATGEAKRRLRDLGQTDEQIYKLDGDWSGFTAVEKALFTVAKQLAASPIVLTDDEFAAGLKLTGPREMVQLVSYVTTRASFNRITETAGLQIEK